MTDKVLKAVREASISIACLLDEVDVNCDVGDEGDAELTMAIEHIQDQITIIENYLDPFVVAELEEMKEDD